jgi:membrane-bound lytic murein transglycosylase D
VTPPQGNQSQATAPALNAPVPKPPAPIAQTGKPAEQRLRVLIQQVDQAYALGESEYRKGRLVEAKAAFDRAVDLMLESGLDIKTHPQLEDEFNRILDQVSGLEMEALKRGNGFAAQEEETPADAAADVTFKVDPAFLARAQADLATTKSDLPLVVNEYVASYINFFANTKKGHYTLLHSLQRAGRYKAMIQRVMAEEGVPQDLIYLAVAESGFNPRAVGPMTRSGGRAGGMWQFMPSGNYGLVRNSYVDERFDPEKSTRASARYMKFIYDQLGDWYLTMAGYNWGAGNVQHAVEKTGYADFWELYRRHNLPAETANYVPEILAAIIVANNPTKYGLDDLTFDPPILTDTVAINYSIDLRLVSDLVGTTVEDLEALNPSLLHRVTPPDANFDLHLPAGTATLYEQRVAAIPESHRNAWRYHRVVEGESLASIAREFHVGAAQLADANQMHEDDEVKDVEAVVVPQVPVTVTTAHARPYTTRKGDSLVTIADRFGVSLTQLRQWNKLPGTGVKMEAGRKLIVAEPANVTRATGSRRHSAASVSVESSAPASTSKKTHAASGKQSAPAESTKSKHPTAKGAASKSATSKSASSKSTTGKPAQSKAAPAAGKSRAHKTASKQKSAQ